MKRCSDHYEETGIIDDKPGRGRNHVIFNSEDKAIVLLLEQKTHLPLKLKKFC